MKIDRRIEHWKIEYVYENRDNFHQADYQRNPMLWKKPEKQRLIDSILTNIDIPKIYLNEFSKGQYEIIDGQQRLFAIWGFIANDYEFESTSAELKKLDGKFFDDLKKNPEYQKYYETILDYELQFTVIKNVSKDYLRNLFLRLQLGLLLVVGEKLKAEAGELKDFVFDKMVKHPFINEVDIKNIRYAKQALCSQICINSFRRAKLNTFSRTRYEDLYYFFREYREVTGAEKKFFKDRCDHIMKVLDTLHVHFKENSKKLKNRSFILSLYLFVEELFEDDIKNKTNTIKKTMPLIVGFSMILLQRLKEEARLGINRKNEELYKLESYLSNAPGEKYQIEKRHEKLAELLE